MPVGVEVDVFYVLDGEDDEHLWAMGEVLDDLGAESTTAWPRPPQAQYHVGQDTHRWDEATFDHIARNKDRLIEKALDGGYDHLLFVDSDLILEPTTVHSMLRVDADLVSACFWTHWHSGDDRSLGPNVWLRHPYEQEGLGMRGPEFWRRLATRRVTHVAGGGACMLVNRSAMEKGVRYFPRIANLPDHGMYRGEDRSFCIKAKRLHLSHVVDPWPDIFHAYHRDQRTEESIHSIEKELFVERREKPEVGDLVSLSLTALEEESLVGVRFPVRGRLGQLELLPEIEDSLQDMTPGDERILNLRYPAYWPKYHGEHRMVRVELVDCKPWGFAPNLVDHVCRGLEPPQSVL